MKIKDPNSTCTRFTDVPLGGVFRSNMTLTVYQKMSGGTNNAVDVITGKPVFFTQDAPVTVYPNATLVLE